ncbi:Uncharacterized protein GBIM_17744, partial [Gryllus bimaculatus]
GVGVGVGASLEGEGPRPCPGPPPRPEHAALVALSAGPADAASAAMAAGMGAGAGAGAPAGTRLQLRCRAGYRDPSAPCADFPLVCEDGEWRGRLPHCEPADGCPPPPASPHAAPLGLSTDGRYAPRAQVAYACLPGYALQGPALLTCAPSGCWEPQPAQPVCKLDPRLFVSPRTLADYLSTSSILLVSAATVLGVMLLLLGVCALVVCRRGKAVTAAARAWAWAGEAAAGPGCRCSSRAVARGGGAAGAAPPPPPPPPPAAGVRRAAPPPPRPRTAPPPPRPLPACSTPTAWRSSHTPTDSSPSSNILSSARSLPLLFSVSSTGDPLRFKFISIPTYVPPELPSRPTTHKRPTRPRSGPEQNTPCLLLHPTNTCNPRIADAERVAYRAGALDPRYSGGGGGQQTNGRAARREAAQKHAGRSSGTGRAMAHGSHVAGAGDKNRRAGGRAGSRAAGSKVARDTKSNGERSSGC